MTIESNSFYIFVYQTPLPPFLSESQRTVLGSSRLPNADFMSASPHKLSRLGRARPLPNIRQRLCCNIAQPISYLSGLWLVCQSGTRILNTLAIIVIKISAISIHRRGFWDTSESASVAPIPHIYYLAFDAMAKPTACVSARIKSDHIIVQLNQYKSLRLPLSASW